MQIEIDQSLSFLPLLFQIVEHLFINGRNKFVGLKGKK